MKDRKFENKKRKNNKKKENYIYTLEKRKMNENKQPLQTGKRKRQNERNK